MPAAKGRRFSAWLCWAVLLARTTAVPQAARSTVPQALILEGACTAKGFLNGLIFEEAGTTADGRPFFKAAGREDYIYYDEDCDGPGGGTSFARWIIDSDRPSTTALADLDQDGKCDRWHARWNGDTLRPPSAATWRMNCGAAAGGFIDLHIKLADYKAAIGTAVDPWMFDPVVIEEDDCKCGSITCDYGVQEKAPRCETVYAVISCDCSYCTWPNVWSTCSCAQPAAYLGVEGPACQEALVRDASETWRISGNGVCRPRCPPGMAPSVEALACKVGNLVPESYTCLFVDHSNVPQERPSFLRFVDFDPLPLSVAGRLDLRFDRPFGELNASRAQVLILEDSAPDVVATVPLGGRADAPRHALDAWLARQPTSGGRLEARVSIGNAFGMAATATTLPIYDLAVEPPHPRMGEVFAVAVLLYAGSLRLSMSADCSDGWIRPSSPPQLFKVSVPVVYSVCGCQLTAAPCLADEGHRDLLGRLAVHGKAPALRPAPPAVPGSPFFLEITGPLLHPRTHVTVQGCRAQPVSSTGTAGFGRSLGLSGLLGTSAAGLTGFRISSQRWMLIASDHGDCQVAWADHQCTDGEEACSIQDSVWGQPLGAISVLPCSPPCLTCRELPTICTACVNALDTLRDGICSPPPTSGSNSAPGYVLESLYSSNSSALTLRRVLPATALERGLAQLKDPDFAVRPDCALCPLRIHCRDRVSWPSWPPSIVQPRSMAALSSGELLIVDPFFEVPFDAACALDTARVPPKSTSKRFGHGAVFVLDFAKGSLDFACPTCCGDDLLYPEVVRVAPTGAFWLIVDTGNAALRRVDAMTKDMSLVAGHQGGGLDSCRTEPGELFERTPVSQDGVVEDLIFVRLCKPSGVSIHEDGNRFLLVERGGCRKDSAPRVRLIDQRAGLIYTIKSFEASCLDALHVEWLPGGLSSFVVVICGKVQLIQQDLQGLWVATPFERTAGSPLVGAVVVGVHAARDGESIVFLTSTRGVRGNVIVSVSPAAGSGSGDFVVAGVGKTPVTDGKRLMAEDVMLLNVTSFAVGFDGSVMIGFVSRRPEGTRSHIARAFHRCPLGTGEPVALEGDGALRGCRPCSRGTFNDGSSIDCQPCRGFGTGTSTEGAAHCECLPGFRQPNQNFGVWPCETCGDGWYCPGSTSQPMACSADSVTFTDVGVSRSFARELRNSSASVGDFVGLRTPGFVLASSSKQCDCCYGRCAGCTAKGSCDVCPDGFWCAGTLAAPDSQVRVQNGFATDATGESGLAFSAARRPLELFRCAHPAHCWWAPLPLTWQALSREPCLVAAASEKCVEEHCAGVQVGGDLNGGCRGGREGLACGRCAAGRFAAALDEDCQDCRFMLLKILGAFVIYLVLIAAFMGLLRGEDGWLCDWAVYGIVSTLALLADYSEQIRLLTFYSTVQLPHGAVPDALWSVAGLSYWRVLPLSVDCLVGSDLAARRALSLLFALLVLAAPAVVIGLRAVVRRCRSQLARSQADESGPGKERHSTVSVTLLFGRVVFSPLTAAAMNFFQCYSHPGGTRDGLWYSPDVLCAEDAWARALPIAAVLLLLPLGLLAWQICSKRHLEQIFCKRERHRSEEELRKLHRSRWLWCRLRIGMLDWDTNVQLRILLVHALFATDRAEMPILQLYGLFFSHLYALVRLAMTWPYLATGVTSLEFTFSFSTALLVVVRMGLLPRSDSPVAMDVRHLGASGIVTLIACSVVLCYILWLLFVALWEGVLSPKRHAKREANKVNDFSAHLLATCEQVDGIQAKDMSGDIELLSAFHFKLVHNFIRTVKQAFELHGTRQAGVDHEDKELEQNSEDRGRSRPAVVDGASPAGVCEYPSDGGDGKELGSSSMQDAVGVRRSICSLRSADGSECQAPLDDFPDVLGLFD